MAALSKTSAMLSRRSFMVGAAGFTFAVAAAPIMKRRRESWNCFCDNTRFMAQASRAARSTARKMRA